MYLENKKLNDALQSLIPEDSPSYAYFRFKLIDLVRSQDFIFQIEDAFKVTPQDTPNFDEVQSDIRSDKKTEEWSVTYLLASFLQRYHDNSVTMKFFAKYLQVLLLIAYRDNGHDKKVKNLCLRVRMALDEHKAQHQILKKLIEIHQNSNDLEDVFKDIQLFEQTTLAKESSGEFHNENLAQKIGQIRYAYEVAYKDKKIKKPIKYRETVSQPQVTVSAMATY